jgi:hypothetical protein
MGLRITGQFDKLAAFGRKLSSAPRLLGTLSRNLAEESITLAAEGYRAAQDPYGAAWPPRKSRGGGRALLVRTGALRNSASVAAANKRFFIVAYTMAYAQFHQRGTRRMARRSVLPRGGRIPGSWAAAYSDVFEELMGDHFR